MHPLVVAKSPLEGLLDAVGRLTSSFSELAPGQEAVNTLHDGYPIVVGELSGFAFFLEYGGTVFALCWGLLQRLSRELDTLVIGASCDLSEDQCEILVARSGAVQRAFSSNPHRTTKPYSLGDPLPCEATLGLAAHRGVGIQAALKAFGFHLREDAAGIVLGPHDRYLVWNGDIGALMQGDEFRERISDHVRAHLNPAYRWPAAKVRVRDHGEKPEPRT